MIVGLNTLTLAILYLFCAWLYRRHGSLLQLGILFAANLALDYPLRTLELFFFPDDSRPSYPGLTAHDSLITLSWMQLLGIAAFCAGYALVDRRVKVHAILQSKARALKNLDFSVIVFVYLFSLTGKAYKILTGNYVSFILGERIDYRLANLFENIHMLGWVAFAAVWLFCFYKKLNTPFRMAFFFVVNIVELAYQLIQGSKTFLLLPALVILMSFYYVRRKVPYAGIATLVLFAVFVVFPFVTVYREYFQYTYRSDIPEFGQFEAAQALRGSYDETFRADRGLKERTFFLLSRFGGTDEFYNMRVRVPRWMPYKYGGHFLAVPYSMIPRFIWPSKPFISPGGEYGESLGTVTAVTPFPLGEAYWNLGLPGVASVLLIWGAFLAAIMLLFDWLAGKPRAGFFVVSIYIMQLYWLTTGEGMLSMLVASLPKMLVFYWLTFQAAAFLSRGGRSPRHLSAAGSAIPVNAPKQASL